jgi:hypothetical protein
MVQITNEIFPGEVTLGIVCDPLNPNEKTVEFEVTSSQSVKQIVEKRREWHRRIAKTEAGPFGRLSLSVIPLE